MLRGRRMGIAFDGPQPVPGKFATNVPIAGCVRASHDQAAFPRWRAGGLAIRADGTGGGKRVPGKIPGTLGSKWQSLDVLEECSKPA